jgi:hypothetical protein
MKNVTKLISIISPAVFAAAAYADIATLAGLAFYADKVVNPDSNDALPVYGADVYLYKRTAEGGWELFYEDPAITDAGGYYVFEDVDVGTGENGLCENSD